LCVATDGGRFAPRLVADVSERPAQSATMMRAIARQHVVAGSPRHDLLGEQLHQHVDALHANANR
jgi:hypothetical protein